MRCPVRLRDPEERGDTTTGFLGTNAWRRLLLTKQKVAAVGLTTMAFWGQRGQWELRDEQIQPV